MKTRNIPIRSISDADAFGVEVYNFNGAYRCLYKRIEESSDSAFKTEFIRRFNLNDILYRSLVSLIIAQKKAKEEQDKEKQQTVDDIYRLNAFPLIFTLQSAYLVIISYPFFFVIFFGYLLKQRLRAEDAV